MVDILFIVIITIFLIGGAAFVILNFLDVCLYPSPKFTCSECEQVEDKNGIYKCKACKNEISGELLYCNGSRRTRDCYKNARKASDEQ